MAAGRWTRYVAVGDSITEGLCDPVVGRDGSFVGWADRLAAILDGDARASGERTEFANLAVRGRRVRDVVTRQIPRAISLHPDLVSVMVGGNDLMAARADPDALASEVETGVVALRSAGIDVLLATCFDPQFSFLRPFRGRAAVFNANLWSIARTHGTHTLDLWGIRELQDNRVWSQDRIHLSTPGHRLLADRAAAALGVPYTDAFEEEARTSIPPLTTTEWLRTHAIPWFGRRLRRVSLGDGMEAKLPHPIDPQGALPG
ncbi:MAG: hypothetical protein RI885_1469 [Actinomycetota bacterium]|jgi:lysophospholipase L1-like esterase